jgi:hypothetical protein
MRGSSSHVVLLAFVHAPRFLLVSFAIDLVLLIALRLVAFLAVLVGHLGTVVRTLRR